jgi:hypothetical protein
MWLQSSLAAASAVALGLGHLAAAASPSPQEVRAPDRMASATVLAPDQAPPAAISAGPTLADARRQFYDGRYVEAADAALALRTSGGDDPATYELRSSALLFEIKRLIGEARDKEKAFRECASCPDLLAALLGEVKAGQSVARAALAASPDDEGARFLLGKLNLNYIWLQLGVLGRRTGWDEYWEARRSMDAILKRHPRHVRARVAKAWIEYIVDTRTPWGFGWILGGGSKKRALEMLRAAAADPDAAFFDRIEAEFALWEMLVRERNRDAAAAIARRLAAEFPENRELRRFLANATR